MAVPHQATSVSCFALTQNKTAVKNGQEKSLRTFQSSYITLSVPGAFETEATGISSNNIVGNCTFYLGNNTFSYRGFLFNGSTYVTLNVPGAVSTHALGMSGNNIVGQFSLDGNTYQGFLYDGSSYSTFSIPGAANTEPSGISGNNIVGTYYAASGLYDGFLRNPAGNTTLDVPGALATGAAGIDGNNIVGWYNDRGAIRAFLATPVPEPSAMGLLVFGAIAWLIRKLC